MAKKITQINNEKKYEDLIQQYIFLENQCKELMQSIILNGATIESPANGSVRNPEVVVYDTFLKQKLNVNKQMLEIEEKLSADQIEKDDDW